MCFQTSNSPKSSKATLFKHLSNINDSTFSKTYDRTFDENKSFLPNIDEIFTSVDLTYKTTTMPINGTDEDESPGVM